MTNKNGPVAAGLMRVLKGFPEVTHGIRVSASSIPLPTSSDFQEGTRDACINSLRVLERPRVAGEAIEQNSSLAFISQHRASWGLSWGHWLSPGVGCWSTVSQPLQRPLRTRHTCRTARQLLSAVGSVGFHTVRERPRSSGCEERVILVPAPRAIFLNRFQGFSTPTASFISY